MKPITEQATDPLLFRVLLLLYPPDVRREFGPAILQLLRDQRRDLGQGTTWGRIRFCWTATADLCLSALRERASVRRDRAHAHASPARYHTWAAGLLIGMAAANIVYDVLSPKLAMGIGALILTALAPCLGILLLLRARRLVRRR